MAEERRLRAVKTGSEECRLAAIMFTDMVGYSALSQRDSNLALELLEERRGLLRESFPCVHGLEIKTIGDAFLVEFDAALEAAECAIDSQRTLAHRDADAPAHRQIQLRIGIHPGDVIHRAGENLWKNADADTPLLTQAKAEYAHLP